MIGCSVGSLAVFGEGAVESSQVALALHVHVLHAPLHVVRVRVQLRVPVVPHGVSEVVKSQAFYLHIVALRHESELTWLRRVVKVAIVAGSHGLEAIADEVSIEVVQQANQSQMIRRNELLQVSLVRVPVRVVLGWNHPLVNAVHTHHRLELVSVIDLIKQLTECICG